MYRFLSIALFAAIFTSASAFTTANSSAALSNSTVSVGADAPDFILSAQLAHFGPTLTSLTATWRASNGGPFTVTLVNVTTGQQVAQVVTNSTFATFNNLFAGNTYQATVCDLNNCLDTNTITL